jgi:hypothetical protein
VPIAVRRDPDRAWMIGQRTSRLWKYIAITNVEESSSFPDAPDCLGGKNDALTDPNGLDSRKANRARGGDPLSRLHIHEENGGQESVWTKA